MQCSREKKKEKEDKLKDIISVQFLDSSLSSVLRVIYCIYMCFSDREVH